VHRRRGDSCPPSAPPISGAVISDKATRGKRRADPPAKKTRFKRTPVPEQRERPGRRADRPENHEGITPEFLQQMRELESEQATDPTWTTGLTLPGSTSRPGVREILAGIDADLRADTAYQQALSLLAYGRG
jgi:hypothetical protein